MPVYFLLFPYNFLPFPGERRFYLIRLVKLQNY
jgi:hypothetical protein